MAATLIGFTGSAFADEPLGAFPSLSMWDAMYALRSGGGYKDNVFLSHTDPARSPFVSAGADITVLRVAAIGPQFSFFGSGDVNRFLDLDHTESTAFAQARLEQDFGAARKGFLAAEYLYQDQVTDLSISETNRQAVPTVGHTYSLRPGMQQNLPQQFWISVETPATRQLFAASLDDYWEVSPKLTIGRSYGQDSYVTLSYEALWSFYDNDPARTATGQAITNEVRRGFQQEARLTWRHYWDEQKHWRTTLASGWRFHDENGGDYFDYTRPFASAQILYRVKSWEISADGRVAHYDYSTQTVSATDLSKRRRTDWSAGIHLERRLSKHFTLLAGYEYEQTLSNDSLETYTVNTVSGSVQWEF